MKESFPIYERRTFENQKALFENKFYNCKIYEDKEDVKGFVCYWKFDNLVFVEHLAVNRLFRGDGIGTEMISDIKKLDCLTVLEVEPENENDIYTSKRIEFYKRNGFYINDYYYEQPPLNIESGYMELKLMTYPKKISEDEFEKIKSCLIKNVYSANTK